jgi:hypothetical protein
MAILGLLYEFCTRVTGHAAAARIDCFITVITKPLPLYSVIELGLEAIISPCRLGMQAQERL